MDKSTTAANLATKSTDANLITIAKMAVAKLAANKDDDVSNTDHHQSGEVASFPQPDNLKPQGARTALRENVISGFGRTI